MLSDSNSDSNEEKFKPSHSILKRILKVLCKDYVGKTRLSQVANVHYTVLVEHLRWMESKRYVKFALNEDKIVVVLTESGREFADRFLTLVD